MVSRARRMDESYDDYRNALKIESVVERRRLKGRWIWRSFVQVERDGEVGFMKTRPYRKPKENQDE